MITDYKLLAAHPAIFGFIAQLHGNMFQTSCRSALNWYWENRSNKRVRGHSLPYILVIRLVVSELIFQPLASSEVVQTLL